MGLQTIQRRENEMRNLIIKLLRKMLKKTGIIIVPDVESMPLNTEVKERFIKFCNDNSISREEIASSIGIGTTQQCVRAWFSPSQDTLPSVKVIYYLMKRYNLNIDWLIMGKK